MSSSFLTCPLCSQPGFQTIDSLCYGLISAATRQVVCPVCHDILFGLDKFTIHLFSHSVQHQREANNSTVPIEISSFRNATAPLNQQSSSPSRTNRLLMSSKVDFNTKGKDITEYPNSNDHTNLASSISRKTIPGSTGCWSKEMITEDKLRMENLNDKQSCKIVSDTSEAIKKYDPEKSEVNSVCEEQSRNNKRDCKCTITSQSNSVALVECTQSNSELVEAQTATKSSQTLSECPQISQMAKIGNISSSLESKLSHPPYHCSSGHVSETTHRNASVHCLVLSSALSQEKSAQVIPTEKGVKGVIRCKMCGFEFEDTAILAIHHQLVHCMESRSETPNHRIEASDGCKQGHTFGEKNQFPCHLCSKAFKMRGSLMVHLRVAHSSGIVSGMLCVWLVERCDQKYFYTYIHCLKCIKCTHNREAVFVNDVLLRLML